jgi:hypothetical protein
MGECITGFLLILIFTTLIVVVGSDDRTGYISKIAKIVLIMIVICCLVACFVFSNPCYFFRDGFC